MSAERDPVPSLLTQHLRLRCLRPEDAPELGDLLGLSPAAVHARIAAERAATEAGVALSFAMTRRSDGRFVGWIGVSLAPESGRRGRLASQVSPALAGFGYTEEAQRAVLAAAVGRLGVETVEAEDRAEAPSFRPLRAAQYAVAADLI